MLQTGVIQFIESMDRTALTISNEEFEKNVEAAVSAIAEKHQEPEPSAPPHIQVAEKSSLSRPEITPRNSMEGERVSPRRPVPAREGKEGPVALLDEQAAAAGLLRTIQKPLSSIGRMFTDDGPRSRLENHSAASAAVAPPSRSPRRSPSRNSDNEDQSATRQPPTASAVAPEEMRNRAGRRSGAEDAAARQASAEAAEARRTQRLEHANIVE